MIVPRCVTSSLRQFQLRTPTACLQVGLALAAALVGGQVRAQTPADSTRSCVDALQPVDSLRNIVSAVVETTDYHTPAGRPRRWPPWARNTRGATRVPMDYLNLVVEEIASRIAIPGGITGGAFVPLRYPLIVAADDTMYLTTPAVRASLVFAIDAEGRLSGVDVWGSTLNHALEEAVFRAIMATDSARAIPPLPRELRRGELLLKVTIEPEQFWNQPPPSRVATRSELRPLFRVSRPVIRVNSLPARALETGPEDPAVRLTPASDTVQFVVSETGAVVAGTLSVSSVAYLQEAGEALEWLIRLPYTPARSGDCALPMLVQIPLR